MSTRKTVIKLPAFFFVVFFLSVMCLCVESFAVCVFKEVKKGFDPCYL